MTITERGSIRLQAAKADMLAALAQFRTAQADLGDVIADLLSEGSTEDDVNYIASVLDWGEESVTQYKDRAQCRRVGHSKDCDACVQPTLEVTADERG